MKSKKKKALTSKRGCECDSSIDKHKKGLCLQKGVWSHPSHSPPPPPPPTLLQMGLNYPKYIWAGVIRKYTHYSKINDVLNGLRIWEFKSKQNPDGLSVKCKCISISQIYQNVFKNIIILLCHLILKLHALKLKAQSIIINRYNEKILTFVPT